jgi:GNAT superfamily N-acetyltransferase
VVGLAEGRVNLGNPDRPVGGLSVPRPEGVEIRPLGRDDLADALSLARELYGLPDADAGPYRAAFESLVNDVDAAPYLALADGTPAGLVVFRFRRRLNHATFEGWISDLVVRERSRGRGIGRTLVAAVIAEWRLRGSHRLVLEVGDERTVARALYGAAGFRPVGRHLELGPIRPTDRGGLPKALDVRAVEATDADFDAVTRLLAEVVRPTPTEERMPALRRTFDGHVRRPDSASHVAVRDGAIVGFVGLEFRQPFFTLAPQAWISDLAVAEAARGQGTETETALVAAALGEATRRGAYGIAAEIPEAAGDARDALRAAGFADVGSALAIDR